MKRTTSTELRSSGSPNAASIMSKIWEHLEAVVVVAQSDRVRSVAADSNVTANSARTPSLAV